MTDTKKYNLILNEEEREAVLESLRHGAWKATKNAQAHAPRYEEGYLGWWKVSGLTYIVISRLEKLNESN